MSERHQAPRAELHQLDDETQLGVIAFGLIAAVGLVLLVRSHPAIAGLAAAVAGGGWVALRHAVARWRDRRAALTDPPAPGVVIGHVQGDWPGAGLRPFRLPWATFRQHVLVAGPTGRGKTFTFIEPLLRAHVSRPSTGIFYLDGKGDPVHRAVPFDHVFYPEHPDESARWNPLAGADPVAAANLFAAGLFPEATSTEATGAFYAARAVHAIVRVVPAMAHTGYGTDHQPRLKLPANEEEAVEELVQHGIAKDQARVLVNRTGGTLTTAQQLEWLKFRSEDRHTPEQLVEAITRQWGPPAAAHRLWQINPTQLSRVLFSRDRLGELAQALDTARRLAGEHPRARTLEQLKHDVDGLLNLPERERATVFQSLENRLGYFLEEPFAQLCAESDFSIVDVAAGARLAFLLPTGRFPNTAKPLGRVALSQFKNAVLASEGDREKVAVLDEFHNFASGDFAAFLNQARSRGGAAIMALQSLGDLPRDEADAMLANISTLIVTPGSRPRDADYFAEAFGKVDTERHAVSYEAPSPLELRGRPEVRTQVVEDYRFSPTQIAELDPREALIQVTAGRQSWPATRVIVERQHG